MRGIVYSINPVRGMVAIQTEGHGFTIIEVTGEDFELGDEVSWDRDTGLGSETYRNVTKGKPVRVFVQNHLVPPQQLTQQLLI